MWDALDDEWRSTRDLVVRAGFEPTTCNVSSAGARLSALAHQGRIERRDVGYRRAQWRRLRSDSTYK